MATTKLPESIFNVEVKNHELLKLAYLTYLGEGRQNLAQTKKRGEVSGGGRKPYKQKGTGQARAGSTRSPIWRGGGITFGPTGNENYTKNMNVSSKRTAIRQALSLSSQEGKIQIVDFTTSGKTSDTVAFLKKNKADKGRVLIVVGVKTPLEQRSVSNLQKIQVVQARYLNVYDVMNADHILMSSASVDIVSEWLAVKAKSASVVARAAAKLAVEAAPKVKKSSKKTAPKVKNATALDLPIKSEDDTQKGAK
jgi:large subunit ribosomal protein L4